jgi:hypothetical protein
MMRLLFRYFFACLSALSLLLCAAVAVLWARNYRGGDQINYYSYQPYGDHIMSHSIHLDSVGGGIAVMDVKREMSQELCQDLLRIEGTDHFQRYAPLRQSYPGSDAKSIKGSANVYGRAGGLQVGIERTTEREGAQVLMSHGPAYPKRALWIVMPHGEWLVLSAVLPALWSLGRWFRWRRRRCAVGALLCQTCGYDLRATEKRCPECGMAIEESRLANRTKQTGQL